MIRRLFLATTIAFSSLSALPADAGTLVDTGAPTVSGFVYGLDGGEFENRLAAKFSLISDSTITGTEVYMTIFGAGALSFQIVSVAGGLPDSGPVLFEATPNLDSNIPGAWTGPSGLDWKLAAGDYWLVLQPGPKSTFWAQLEMGTPGLLPRYANWYFDRPTWFSYAPDPKFGGEFGVRIFGTANAVPEPASWGMMVTGFALMGAAMRRRRMQAV